MVSGWRTFYDCNYSTQIANGQWVNNIFMNEILFLIIKMNSFVTRHCYTDLKFGITPEHYCTSDHGTNKKNCGRYYGKLFHQMRFQRNQLVIKLLKELLLINHKVKKNYIFIFLSIFRLRYVICSNYFSASKQIYRPPSARGKPITFKLYDDEVFKSTAKCKGNHHFTYDM